MGKAATGPPVTAAGYFVPDEALAARLGEMKWYREVILVFI
jgi:hypothetical protein